MILKIILNQKIKILSGRVCEDLIHKSQFSQIYNDSLYIYRALLFSIKFYIVLIKFYIISFLIILLHFCHEEISIFRILSIDVRMDRSSFPTQ